MLRNTNRIANAPNDCANTKLSDELCAIDRRWLVASVCALFVIVLHPSFAIAQVQTGSILSADLDVYNLTNANTVWEVRTLTPSITVREGGDPNGAVNTIPQFLSPTQVLGPRILRFSASFKF
jgi:hypothetical protein